MLTNKATPITTNDEIHFTGVWCLKYVSLPRTCQYYHKFFFFFLLGDVHDLQQMHFEYARLQ